MLQEEPEQQETQPLASVAPQQTTEPVPQEPEPEPAPQEPEPEGTFVGEHMPVSNEKQLASVLTSTAVVNGLLQGAAWLCGGGKMHVMAAIATGVHYLVLIHASGNVFGNQRTEKFFDITGSLTYATVCVVALSTAPGGVQALSQRQLLLAGMVLLWCGRLGTFLFLRIQKHGGLDPRFERPKKYFSTFFTFWNVSAVWVFATSLPALTVLTTDRGPAALGPVDYMGIAGWVVGFLFEVTADYQKETWRARPENREKKTWITEGLWSVCRHPNYFGEILIWSSVLLISMQSLTAASSPKGAWLSCISPFFVTYLLTSVSGMSAMYEVNAKKWGKDKKYLEYLEETAAIYPFLNLPVMTIYALPSAVVIFGVVKALTQ